MEKQKKREDSRIRQKLSEVSRRRKEKRRKEENTRKRCRKSKIQ